VTEKIVAMAESAPPDAYLNKRYEAIVSVASSSATDVKAECPDWMTYEFIQTGSGNYVHLSGIFTDAGLVGSTVNVTVSSSDVTDRTWQVELLPPAVFSLYPSFEWRDAGDGKIGVRYTGPTDRWIKVYFVWHPDAGDSAYIPDADGWMTSPQLQPDPSGRVLVTVKAVRPGSVAATSSQYVTVTHSAAGPGDGSGDGPDDGPGTGSGDAADIEDGPLDAVLDRLRNVPAYAIVGMIAAMILFVASLTAGRYGFAAVFGCIAVSLALFGGSIGEILGGIL